MKIYLQLLILLIPIITFSQKKMEGTYYIPDLSSSTYEYLNFDKDGNFEYAKGGDLGKLQPSKGNYKFKNQLLILDFNNLQLKKLGFDKKKIWRNKNDSVEVKIKVMDLDKNPLEHAFVFVGNDKNLRKETNEKGLVEFKFKKENFNQDFIITWIGFEHYELQIDLNYNFQIEVYLTPDLQEIPIRNQIDTIKIKEFEKTYFKTDKNIIWKKSEQEY